VSLDTLKDSLCGRDRQDPAIPVPWDGSAGYSDDRRMRGADWPRTAVTMIGRARLDHLQWCVETVLDEGVPGDLLEAGVWRGGACILMRAVLKERGVTDRTVWAADSFSGFPPGAAEEENMAGAEQRYLAVPLDEVQRNFASYDMLDGQVRFLPGYFSSTLPRAPVGQLAVLRLDADLCSSTWTVLANLHPKVSDGGFVIIDDWNLISCQHAVRQFRAEHGITSELQPVPGCEHDGAPQAMYWRKS
jgi:Macrocin-O-methyltransferase (TylF)